MATPTITTVTPTTGPSGGLSLVQITGTNFRLPTAQPAYGPSVPRGPTVAVYIGGEPAADVEVTSATTLYCRAPAYMGVSADDALPPSDVRVQNLDDAGAPISGEVFTRPAAYRYFRPRIHGAPASGQEIDSPDLHVAGSLAKLLQRQVIDNVAITTHVDYAEPGVITVNVSKVPALVVQGPTVTRDGEYGHNEPVEVDNGDGTFSITRPPRCRRHTYTIIGVSDNEQEMLNLMASVETCFEAVKHLPIELEGGGRALPVLQLTAPPQSTNAPSDSNIRTFLAVCEVRGIEISPPGPTARAFKTNESDLEAQELDGTSVETTEVF